MSTSQPAVNRRQEGKSEGRWLAFVGDCPQVASYINNRSKSPSSNCIQFANALFRGYGQVVFANNPFSGVLVMVALLWADWTVGLRGLYSAVIALAISIVLRHPKDEIENGLTVFNPLLLGQVCGALLPGRFGIEFEVQHWVFLGLGSIATVYVTSSLASLLGSIGKFPIPCLALPFCVVQFLFFVTAIHLNIPTPLNTTSVTSNVELISPSENMSAILERQVLPQETTSEFILSSIETVSTSSIQTSTPKEMTTLKTNLEAKMFGLNSTRSYAVTETTLAEGGMNSTETHHSPEVVTNVGNITQYKNNNSIVDQTLEKMIRHKRDHVNQSSDDSLDEKEMEENLHWGQIFAGIILSMTQVFGACHVPAAVMIYLAVLIYSPITAIFCLAGAIIATITGAGFLFILIPVLLFTASGGSFDLALNPTFGIGLSTGSYDLVYNGVWGFNGLLIAGAFSFFLVVTWQSTVMTIFSVLFGAVLQNLLMLSLEESNLPVVSIPFNLTVILFLCLGPDRNDRGLIRPLVLSYPEKHRDDLYAPHHEADQVNSSKLAGKYQDEPDTEKRAPLAEQEVV